MAKGKKTNPEDITKILTSYAITNSYSETSKQLNIPYSTVKDIVDKNKDTEEFVKLREEKKELFSTRANSIIDKALDLLDRRYTTALKNQKVLEELLLEVIATDDEEISNQEKKAIIRKINKLEINSLSEITTSMGTLFDKMRLATGETTENNEFNVNIKVVK